MGDDDRPGVELAVAQPPVRLESAVHGEALDVGGDQPAPVELYLDEPPFYAVEVAAGALGTCGGPKTDADARVLDLQGHPIEGLYACSNAMAGVTAGAYGGAGGTLAPGMTFGYIAGCHAAPKG